MAVTEDTGGLNSELPLNIESDTSCSISYEQPVQQCPVADPVRLRPEGHDPGGRVRLQVQVEARVLQLPRGGRRRLPAGLR